MADNIKISTQVLTDTAQKVRNCNTAMDDKLKEINDKMDALGSTWKSDAATDIRDAMNALKSKFEQYKNVIESYATFLVNTAQSYESTEGAIQTNANAFK